MNVDYVLWARKVVDNATTLKGIQGVEDEWELNEGISRSETFSQTASFQMDLDRPDDTVVLDSISNIDFLIVASPRLTEFLRNQELKKVEYLPVTIFDHKEKPLPEKYFIVHPIDPIDCLDTAKCGATFSKINPESVKRLQKLVIRNDLIDGTTNTLSVGRLLFRPRNFYRITFVHRNLAEAIDAAGFTGIRWVEIRDYPRPNRK